MSEIDVETSSVITNSVIVGVLRPPEASLSAAEVAAAVGGG